MDSSVAELGLITAGQQQDIDGRRRTLAGQEHRGAVLEGARLGGGDGLLGGGSSEKTAAAV